jgi:signal transduction histidine kinase/ligand-binding sensor domain-containing protein
MRISVKRIFIILLLLPLLIHSYAYAPLQAERSSPALIPVNPPEIIPYTSSTQLRFEHISIEQGLSQSSVNAILQDQQGFLWFATQDGLNRYDGYEFKIYQSIPGDANSLSHNFILSLVEDRQGNLWIGTQGFGLDRFDPQSGMFSHFQQTKSDQYIKGRYILSLLTTWDGTVWAGTEEGLSWYDTDENRFFPVTVVNDEIKSGVQVIYEDQSGRIWIGTHEEGVGIYDRKSDTYQPLAFADLQNTALGIHSIMQDRDGNFWLGTTQGLFLYNAQTRQFMDFPGSDELSNTLVDHHPKCILQDQTGQIWIGTDNGGLILYNLNNDEESILQTDLNQNNGLNNNNIISMLEDSNGNLWFGTFSSGVNLLNRFAAPMEIFRTTANGMYHLNDDLIWSIAADPYGNIWVGTEHSGINRINLYDASAHYYTSSFNTPAIANDSSVEALLFSSQGILWAGTSSGSLSRYNPQTRENKEYRIGNSIHSIFEDRNHILWLGMEGNNLLAFDPQSETQQNYDLILGDASDQSTWGHIYCVRQDADGRLWVASNTGLYDIDENTRKITRHHLQFDPQSYPSSQTIMSIHINNDAIWLGTFGEGLIAYHPETDQSERYTMQDGLPNNVIYGILDDEYGRLWLSTNKGLSCFEPKSKTFINYDINDGLQSSEFNAGAYTKGVNGELLFGGINGMNRFYPQRFRKNPTIPAIVLTDLMVNGKSLRNELDINRDPIVLEWPNNNFEFEFVALNYIQPEDNQYAYKLEKVDEDWVYIGDRRYGQFTNLAGGNYTLRLKGSNNDNIWNESGLSIQIQVIPPFWQTWWFITLMALLAGAMIVGFYKLRMRNIHANNLRLETEVRQRTSELMETNQLLKEEIAERERAESELSAKAAEEAVTNERNRLARELHDAVTQSLYGVNLYAEAASRMLAAGKIDPTAENITELQKSAREALQEMRLLIYELRPSVLVKGGLLHALENRLDSVEKRVGIKTDFQHNLCQRLPAQYELSLYRIAQESLNNILKHAQATMILIRLWDQKDRIVLKIQDNGIGFEALLTMYNGGMGLKIMKERAETLGGEFQIISSPGKGTTILVEVLYDKAHSTVDCR